MPRFEALGEGVQTDVPVHARRRVSWGVRETLLRRFVELCDSEFSVAGLRAEIRSVAYADPTLLELVQKGWGDSSEKSMQKAVSVIYNFVVNDQNKLFTKNSDQSKVSRDPDSSSASIPPASAKKSAVRMVHLRTGLAFTRPLQDVYRYFLHRNSSAQHPIKPQSVKAKVHAACRSNTRNQKTVMGFYLTLV